MNQTLKVWRQKGPKDAGRFVAYEARDVTEHMSFLEMLDVVNEGLVARGEPPITFDHDCREGICGTSGFVINGVAHGPRRGTTVCQLHMRSFQDGKDPIIGFVLDVKGLMADISHKRAKFTKFSPK